MFPDRWYFGGDWIVTKQNLLEICDRFGFEERSSRTSFTFEVDGGGVADFQVFVVGGSLCHRGSDRLPSRSEEPCHCSDDFFLPCVFR